MVHKLPEDNLENYYINRFGRKLYSMFFEGYTEKLWGHHRPSFGRLGRAARPEPEHHGCAEARAPEAAAEKRDTSEVETSLIRGILVPQVWPGQLWETVGSAARTRA